MSLSVNAVSFKGTDTQTRPSQVKTAGTTSTNLLNQCGPKDSVCFKGDEKDTGLTELEKKEIVRSARSNASGWAIVGGPISLLYYGMRSNLTVAKKYQLDPEEDKALIKEIKTQQMLWTIPACVPGLGIIPGVVSWLYNQNMNPENIDL